MTRQDQTNTSCASRAHLPQVLDTRFLTVHPRTALWWQQREKCAVCAHQVVGAETPRNKGAGGVHCSLTDGGGFHRMFACVQAREEGQPCGPDALRFEPKEAA